jgi:predicted Zn-dependent protease
MIDGIVYGDDPRQGYQENHTFYHPELKFQFPVPANWNLENTPQQVNMVSSSKDAIIVFALSQENKLEDAANTLTKQFGLQLNGSERVRINGLEGLNLRAVQTSQNQTLHLNIFLIKYADNIYEFLGVTTQQQFTELISVTEGVAHGFDKLSDPSKLNVQPRRIAIKQATSNSTLREALSRHGVPKDKFNEHALINGKNLDQTIDKGALFKVIVGKNFSESVADNR